MLDVFSQHFWPDQLLLKRHPRRIPLLSHWHVHLHADSTGDAERRAVAVENMSKAKGLNLLSVQCEAPKMAKLVYNSNNYSLWHL